MEFNEGLEPVSPSGHYYNSSVMSISVIAVFEFEVPINDLQIMSLVKDVFLPINPRFSSIMVNGQNGWKQWKKIEVKLEDHVHVPIFPTGNSPELYDEYLDDYLTMIATGQFPQNKPLWEIHLIKYPTSNAAGNLIFKLHHALGDGFSLMGALLSCLQRADNPSLPLTFPSRKRSEPETDNKSAFRSTVPRVFSFVYNTISEFAWSILKSSLVEDDRTPIRSGDEGVAFRPISISSMTFSLHHIKQIKAKLGVTVNDVITGIIFYGIRLCMEESSHKSSKAHCTALVLLNTRVIRGYKSVKEMIKPDSDTPWGNQFAFLHVLLPKFTNAFSSNPLGFVWKTHKIIKRQRSSLAVHLTGKLLEIVKKLRGPETASRYIHTTLKNSSMTISNMIGPEEQMALADHPIKGLYHMVAGVPQNLTVTILSYMGNIRVSFGIEKDFLDRQKLKSCMEKAFEVILKAANEIPT